MTSEEINKESRRMSEDPMYDVFWLKEIAYQLAVANERKAVDIPAAIEYHTLLMQWSAESRKQILEAGKPLCDNCGGDAVTETFFEMLRNPAHWAFEIFCHRNLRRSGRRAVLACR